MKPARNYGYALCSPQQRLKLDELVQYTVLILVLYIVDIDVFKLRHIPCVRLKLLEESSLV